MDKSWRINRFSIMLNSFLLLVSRFLMQKLWCTCRHACVTVMHVDMAVEKRKLPKISGISRYNNVEFQNFDSPQTSDIVVWEAYKIGRGLKLPRKSWRNY